MENNQKVMTYPLKEFNVPKLTGISAKTITEHLQLYKGYVTNVNKIHSLIANIANHDEYVTKEAYRRLGFEFGGMRNHEYYFAGLEGGATEIDPNSNLCQKITDQFGSFDSWLDLFKGVLAKQRGVGWAILGYDTHTSTLLNYWVDEQHQGHLTGVQPLLTLDMWEHSYCLDYAPSEKTHYIDAYLSNLNWSVIEGWFDNLA